MKSLRILAIIPARAGSKRLPGKNKKLLAGKPLIVWTVEIAQSVEWISDILITTDDPDVAEIGRRAGVMVPWLRPEKLATDTATSVDVVMHALDWYEEECGEVDAVLLLQPTVPFRDSRLFQNAFELFSKDTSVPVVGVSPMHQHPLWAMKFEGEYCVPFFEDHGLNLRSQDLTPAYSVNGSLYLCSSNYLRSNRSFFKGKINAVVSINEKEFLDIDTHADWDKAVVYATQ